MTVEFSDSDGESAEAVTFPHVARLGKSEGKAAAESLSALCAELTKSGAHTAVKRLRDIDEVVGDLPFPVIERLVAPERVLAELDEVQTQPVRRLHAWRNQLALLPLFITWVSLAIAVLMRSPSGELLGPMFAVVALVDAVLIGLVVVLTQQTHKKEAEAARDYDRVARQLDGAITSLAIAAESEAVRTPANAEQWADATRRVIQDAMKQTAELSEANREVVTSAAAAVESAHTKADDLVRLLAEQTRSTLQSLQQANEQIITQVVKEAVTVLHDAVAADRSLINDQMAPLVAQFRSSVDDFTKSYSTYQASTATFVAVTADLGSATNVLAESAKSYSDIAGSIDGHLRTIEGSQDTFITQVTESVKSMGTAADAMEGMSTLLRERLRADLEKITVQLTNSSERLSAVDGSLVGTTAALAGAARQLQDAAAALDRASHGRRSWPFGRNRHPTES
jgi:hypothetical protein